MRYRPQKSALPLTAADRVKIERLLLFSHNANRAKRI